MITGEATISVLRKWPDDIARALQRWPPNWVERFAGFIDEMFAGVSSPVFAIIVAVILVEVTLVNPRLIVWICSLSGWFLSVIALHRPHSIRRHPPLSRLLTMFGLAILFFGIGCGSLFEYKREHVGKLHILGFTPVKFTVGQSGEVDAYYENVGDASLQFRTAHRTVLIRDVGTLSAADWKQRIDYAFAQMAYLKKTEQGATFVVTPHFGEHLPLTTDWNLDPEVIGQLNGGNARFLTVGYMHYLLPTGKHDVEFCLIWGQADGTVAKCSDHNWE